MGQERESMMVRAIDLVGRSRRARSFLFGLVVGFGFASFPLIGAEDIGGLWKGVLALDAGPSQPPRSVEEAKGVFSKHTAAQESALRRFLESATQDDPRRFEAQIRLARVLTIRAELESKPEWQEESARILDGLDGRGSREQRAEVAFTRISQWMRRNRFANREQRQELLAAVREFRQNYPADRRLALLLVEVATRFDCEPQVKGELLAAASRANQDPGLRKRIEDDQARLELYGKPLVLRFQDLNGRNFRLEDLKGRPAVVFYFAANSLPALEAWVRLNQALAGYPEMVRVGISLDEDRVQMESVRKQFGDGWTIAWEGRGWLSALARRWGVNSLPTAWLVDAKGAVVSLNAMEDLKEQLSALNAGTKGKVSP